MYVDSHAHLGDDRLYPISKELLERAASSNVEGVVNICTDVKTLERGMELAKTLKPKIVLSAATTPHDVEHEGESFFKEVEQAALEQKLHAIGETGLDYYYEHSPKELQKKYLLQYFYLALRAKLPLIFHCREAFDDLFSMADQEYKNSRAVLHCFTGTLAEAKKVLERGWKISFSGIITFKKSESLREIVRYVPLDSMFIETDAPYLAPQSKRGEVNEPSFVLETAKMIADIKKLPVEEIAKATTENAKAFFAF
jgi:TatD DNase family protein